MKSLTNIKSLLVRILSLLLLFNVMVLANNLQSIVTNSTYSTESSIQESTTGVLSETVEVSLDSFTNMGLLIMVALTSLLGAFFLKDEFSSMLE